MAEAAEDVVATDAAGGMLAIAGEKGMPAGKVEFLTADAYALGAVAGTFDAAVAMFWLSHVPKDHMQAFLRQLVLRKLVLRQNLPMQPAARSMYMRCHGQPVFRSIQ